MGIKYVLQHVLHNTGKKKAQKFVSFTFLEKIEKHEKIILGNNLIACK